MKWKNDKRNEWELEFEKARIWTDERMLKYHEERKTMHRKAEVLALDLIPELLKFAETVRPLRNQELYGQLGISDILELEGFVKNRRIQYETIF